MAKYTRTLYAEGNLRDIAHEIAGQAAIAKSAYGLPGELGMAYDCLHERRGKGRKRVRITILVEPEAAPVKARAPRRPRPVQASLPLEASPA